MHFLRGKLSSMLCCFGVQQDDLSHTSATLRNIPNNASPISARMPIASIPNAASTSEDLQRIFAPDMTPGGYNAASNSRPKRLHPQGSLDLSFQFGSETPGRQPAGRIEQFARHIKQQLSESRLGRSETTDSSNGAEMVKLGTPGLPVADENTQLLGVSQRSTGITELLTSRAGSEGGYDSDAKSIYTPMLRSNAGTINLSPAFVRKSLKTIQSEGGEEPNVFKTSASESKATPALEHSKSESSPHPDTPTKVPFATALQIESDESPSDVLRRPGVSMANGTVKAPDTPELRAMRVQDLTKIDHESRLSLTAPRRTSSLSRPSTDVHETMKRLSDRIETAKRHSATSSSPSQQDSLISQLDPTLIGLIEQYVKGDGANDRANASSSESVTKSGQKQHGLSGGAALTGSSKMTQSHGSSMHDVSSTTTSNTHSLHLFNMRISQRLASDSRVAMVSSNQTSSQSLASLPDNKSAGQASSTSMGRYPTFITTEHVRQPSDPLTKRLFETTSDATPATAKWKPCIAKPAASPVSSKKPLRSRNDSCSSYGSQPGGQISTSPTTTRRSSIKNPNSIGVAGRSFSDVMPIAYIDNQLKTLADSGRLQQQQCNNSWPTKDSRDTAPSGFHQRHDSKTAKSQNEFASEIPPPLVDRHNRGMTEDNEGLSQESLSRLSDRRNEQFSEISAGGCLDRSNESFGEADPVPSQFHNTLLGDPHHFGGGQPIRSDHSNLGNNSVRHNCDGTFQQDYATTRTPPKLAPASISCTGDAIQDSTIARLQQTPAARTHTPNSQTNQSRDRYLSMRNAGNGGIYSRRLSQSTSRKRSQSADGGRKIAQPALEKDKHKRSMPLLKHTRDNSVMEEHLPNLGKSKSKRKSLIELSHWFTTASTSRDQHHFANISSTKENLGPWAKFPTHIRAARNSATGKGDGVQVYDFDPENSRCPDGQTNKTPAARSTASLSLRNPSSWGFSSIPKSSLQRSKTRSMNFASGLEERAKRRRKGLVGRFRRLYRSQSSEMRAFSSTRGHRSSISTSKSPEYPELECLPSEGAFGEGSIESVVPLANTDGNSFNGVEIPKSNKSFRSRPWTTFNADQWTNIYTDCVGSLSAIRSESGETFNKQKAIEATATSSRPDAAVKADPCEQDQDIGTARSYVDGIAESLHKASIELKMPGSFE